VKVFKVVPRLYTGELKTLYSRNPLDEQVTLRHTGDFAARPQEDLPAAAGQEDSGLLSADPTAVSASVDAESTLPLSLSPLEE
jgi:hypothetical protein